MSRNSRLTIILTAIAGLSAASCAEDAENYGAAPWLTVSRAPLVARCSISVNGFGAVDMETDYVPNTTWCENGGAGTEALKAQAVAARTYAYYKISVGATPVSSSESDQVYSCPSRAPSAAQFDTCLAATRDTAGQVMTYNNVVTAGFYVSGVKQQYLAKDCTYKGKTTSDGYVSVQKFVTYNSGKSGSGITQTTLGWVEPTNYANRGCMSQNGARCLSDAGKKYDEILRFFYGEDIKLEVGSGECDSAAPSCTKTIGGDETIIDERDGCFSRSASESWYEADAGHDGHLYFTYVWDQAAETIGTWTANFAEAGTYGVYAYIATDVGAVSEAAPYSVRASGEEFDVPTDLNGKSGWVYLGSFDFAAGGDQWVKLSDSSGEKYTGKSGKRVLFDAIKFVKDGGRAIVSPVDCEDECESAVCDGPDAYVGCEIDPDTGCSVYGYVSVVCGAGRTCIGGSCVADDAPAEEVTLWDDGNGMPSSCVTAVDGRASTVIDDSDGCFSRFESDDWSELGNYGYGGHLYYARGKGADASVGTWYLNVTAAGTYSIYAYIDNGVGSLTGRAGYVVKHASGESVSTINQGSRSGWVRLGEYELAEGTEQYVRLGGGEVGGDAGRVIYDAIKIEPYAGIVRPDDDDDEPTSGNTGGEGDERESQGDNFAPGVAGGDDDGGCSALPLGAGRGGGMAGVFVGLCAAFAAFSRRRSAVKAKKHVA